MGQGVLLFIWIDPAHEFIHFAFRGHDRRLYSIRVREILRLLASETKIHQLCFGQTPPPRRPHGGTVPPTDLVRLCFREPFGEGSRHTPVSLTPIARVLDAIVRRTLLPRLGYRDGLTRMQLWVVHHLISQTPFDIWDLMLCEMEDTLAEGFKGHRQLPYFHWICFLIWCACDLPTEIQAEIFDTTTTFPMYDIRQLWASITREQAPR
jgi:hypothetical protein